MVKKDGDLKENGVRLKGGMQDGKVWQPTLRQAPSSTSMNPNAQSGGDQKEKGSSKGKNKGKEVSNPKASAKAKSKSGDLGEEVKGEELESSRGRVLDQGKGKGGLQVSSKAKSKSGYVGEVRDEKPGSSQVGAPNKGTREKTPKAKSKSGNVVEIKDEKRGSSQVGVPDKGTKGVYPKVPTRQTSSSKNTGVDNSVAAACAAATPEEQIEEQLSNTSPLSSAVRVWRDEGKSPEQKRDSKSSALSFNIDHSQCTDCSPRSSQHQDYHEPVLRAVREFFETHFKRFPFLPKIDITDITKHPHYELACIHNSKKRTTEDTAIQSGQSYPSDMVNVDENKLKGLNMVTASLTFLKADQILHKKILIKCADIPVKQAFGDENRRGNDKWEKKKYHDEVITEFNNYIANLLKNEPELLKEKIKHKKVNGKKRKTEADTDIPNPLLKEDGKSYDDTKKIYSLIKQEVVKILIANNTIQGGRELTDDEERIIVKSIVSARKHAEDELSRHMRSPEFEEKLKKQLNDDKDYEGDLKSLICDSEINRIEMNVHSTLESCLPCQVALRAVRQYLEEKLFPPEEAQAREAAAEEEDLRNPVKERVILRISSQQEYQKQNKSKYIYDEDLKAIQYEATGILSDAKFEEGNEVKVHEATGFMNGPFDRMSNLAESASGSANSQQVKDLQQEVKVLKTTLETAKEDARKEKDKTKLIIKNMLQSGMDITQLAIITKLPAEEIQQVKSELDSETAASSSTDKTTRYRE